MRQPPEYLGLVELVSNNDYDECYRRLDVALDVIEVLEEARKSAGLFQSAGKSSHIRSGKRSNQEPSGCPC